MAIVRSWMLISVAAVGLIAAGGAIPATAATGRPEAIGVAGHDCRAAELPTLGFGVSQLSGGDPSGRYLLGREFIEIDFVFVVKSVVWINRQARELDTQALLPNVDVRLIDANQDGDIVGYRVRDNSSFHQDAWLYRDGRFTLLPGLRSTDVTVPTGINSRGDIVGYSQDPTGPVATYHAVVWPAGHPGTVRELTVPGQPGAFAMGVGIDDDGTVLGWVGGRPGQTNYIWPPRGAPYPLTGPAGVQFIEASAIRNGWVVGFGQMGQQLVGLQWNLRTGQAQVASTEYPLFISVNSRGTIGANGAIIHRNGRTVPLDRGGTPIVLTDSGTAAGMIDSFGGPPVVWTGC